MYLSEITPFGIPFIIMSLCCEIHPMNLPQNNILRETTPIFPPSYLALEGGFKYSSTCVDEKTKTELMANKNESVINAAKQYLHVLNDIGNPNGTSKPHEISRLCTQDCTKIRNGKVLFEQREYFADQLLAAKGWIGNWTIHPLEILPITNPRSAVIRYKLTTQKEGVLLVFVILKFDTNHLIYEINEVHNKLES